MASSTSLEGDLDTRVTRHHQHKHLSRPRQRARSRPQHQQQQQHPSTLVSGVLDQKMGSNGIAYAPLEMDPKLLSQSRTPGKNNLRHKRNLREKRRPTGIVHIISTESAGGTSTSSESDEELDLDPNVKKNTKMNEIVFLPMPTAHLRALAAASLGCRDQDGDDPDDQEVGEDDGDEGGGEEDDEEDVLRKSAEENRSQQQQVHSSDPLDMRTENERLRDQLKFKDKYIKQLEARVMHLEISHSNSFLRSNTPKKRNQ